MRLQYYELQEVFIMTQPQISSSPLILIDGFKLLIKPGIRQYVILPMLFNIGIFAAFLYYGFGLVMEYQALLHDWLPDWLDFLSWIIVPIFFIVATLIMAYGFTTLTNIIAAPFNALLSEKVEAILGLPHAETEDGISGFIKIIPRSITREIKKFISNLKWLLLLFISLFIPGVNILSLIIGSWLMAIQYLDYPADNHQLSYQQFLEKLKSKRFSSMKFGLSILLVSMIPFANLIIVPAAICAGTLLWHKDFHQTEQEN